LVARGERPLYCLRQADDGSWTVIALPWVIVPAMPRRDVVEAARGAIAAWLEVDGSGFDVEVE
jgi:hypothetical protein